MMLARMFIQLFIVLTLHNTDKYSHKQLINGY